MLRVCAVCAACTVIRERERRRESPQNGCHTRMLAESTAREGI